MIVVLSLWLISKRIFSLSPFFLGRKPANTKLEAGIPLETSAVIAAQGPGIQINFISFIFASLISSSPGSHIPGIGALIS